MLISTHPEGVGKSFSLWMLEKREMLGMTRSELAQKCDLSTEMVHKVEQGLRSPSLNTAKKLIDALGVKYTRDDERPRVFHLYNNDTILIMTQRSGRGKAPNHIQIRITKKVPSKSRKRSCF